MNVIKLTGNVGNELVIKDFGIGRLVSFNVAVNSFNSKKKSTSWHKVVAFGKTAEDCEALLCKGKFVSIVGKLRNRKHTNADQQVIYATEIVAFSVREFVTSSSGFLA